MSVRRLTQKMICQQRNIFRALRQRRDLEIDDVQAVVEIFAELFTLHRFWQIAVSSRDNPYVNVDITVAAQRAHFALLQHAQQFDLQWRGHITNFIEEKRPAFCGLEKPFPAAHRARKRAARMPKEFRFKKLFRQRTAVDGDKCVFAAWAGVVNRLRQDLFPGPALPINQQTDVGLRDHSRLLQQAQHNRAARDNGFTPFFINGRSGMFQRIVDGFI
ncbi:hypothetical protein D3C78_836560 [compost metagenome]